jgi:hypothetical protein
MKTVYASVLDAYIRMQGQHCMTVTENWVVYKNDTSHLLSLCPLSYSYKYATCQLLRHWRAVLS